MNQMNPLLNYRIECYENDNIKDFQGNYNFELGLWVDEKRKPLIERFIMSRDSPTIGVTTINETRSGIDRSEKSFDYSSENTNLVGKTLITRSREGIDRAENSSLGDEILLQSLVTYTRESIDRSENS